MTLERRIDRSHFYSSYLAFNLANVYLVIYCASHVLRKVFVCFTLF